MTYFLDEHWAGPSWAGREEGGGPVAGRSTITARLPPSPRAIARAVASELRGEVAPVQARGDLDGPDVHAIAAAGVAGGGGALPYHEEIQRAFGRHDVGGVRAHVGGAAAEAASAIGARAYATDGAVAFAAAPDLHLAAHEAAHVVQQRAGVQLSGGVGARGDVYEQHADAVADRVVSGRSAEDLLDGMAPGGAPASSVQRAVQREEHEPLREREVQYAVQVTPDVAGVRAQIEPELGRQVMSRTEVGRPPAGPAPIRRERQLLDGSNLAAVHETLVPGTTTVLRGRLIPSANGASYERLVFELPPPSMRRPPSPPPREPGLGNLVGPDYRSPRDVDHREERWRRAQARLEHALDGQHVGGGPDVMWTPTAEAISRMMPAVPNLTGTDRIAGEASQRTYRRTTPGWLAMPEQHSGTVRIFARMLESSSQMARSVQAELTDAAIDEVVGDFIEACRSAMRMRAFRRNQLEIFANIEGSLMVERDLRRYEAAERDLFLNDPTCLWRYLP